MKQEVIIKYEINGRDVFCNIVFSSKIKSKIYFSVVSNNEKYDLLVKVPFNTKLDIIEELIKRNYKKLEAVKIRKQENPYINFNNKKIMYLGNSYNLIMHHGARINHCEIQNNNFVVHLRKNGKAIEVIEKFFKKEANDKIVKMTIELANFYRLQVNEIKIKKMHRAWGNCKAISKVISFTYNLMHFDEQIIKYVICHELAHLIYPNHSKQFWNLVENFYPNYKVARKILKQYII